MYTINKFGYDLERKLSERFDVLDISRWAYEKYLSHKLGLNKELSKVIMTLVTMEEGPEFEYTQEELFKIAKELQNLT